jgi:hypothetical protein
MPVEVVDVERVLRCSSMRSYPSGTKDKIKPRLSGVYLLQLVSVMIEYNRSIFIGKALTSC